MNILIFFYLLLFLFLAWRRLDWAVLLIIAALPSYLIRFNVLGIPSTLLEMMILIAFFIWLIFNWRQVLDNIKNSFQLTSNKTKIRYPFDVEIIILLVVSFGAVVAAGFSYDALGAWKAYFFEPVLLFILVVNLFWQERQKNFLEKVIFALAWSALILSLVAFYQKLTGHFIFNDFWAASSTRRVTSFFPYPNALGLYLGPLVLLLGSWLAGAIIRKDKIYKTLFIGLVIIFSVCSIYFAKSEGALFGILAGLIFLGFFYSRKIRLITLAAIVLITAGVYFYQPARLYVVDKITFMDKSGQIRRAGWQETWQMLSDGRMIFGTGLAGYQEAVTPYHQDGIFIKDSHDPEWLRKVLFNEEFHQQAWQPLETYLYPHNIFLNFWSELGLAGLIIFIWLIGKYVWLGIKNLNLKEYKKERDVILGLLCAIIVIMVHGLADVPFFKNDLAIMFFLFLSMMGAIIKPRIKNYER